MKIQILILALFIMPFLAFSQQTGSNKSLANKQTSGIAEKKQVPSTTSVDTESKIKDMEAYRKANNVPDDFPRYVDTGNPKLDEANYYNAKQEWIKNNPVEFDKIKHLAL